MTPPALADLLQPGETLLWQGRIGFNLTSSPVLTALLLALTAYVTASLWIIQSEADFCAAAPGQAGCGFLYRLMPPTALILTGFQTFDMLERRALTSGRAQGAVLLTNRRLIRVCDWPRRRIRAHDYAASPPRRGIGGVIRFGTFGGSVILSPEDAEKVRDLMRNPGKLRT
ncbi:MAG: hypothetical protein O9247_01405 [Rhodobacteraceae bacterium]|nr:hypothetical protein [Paracoccaceae bacterium]